jgi:hypothetical protein
MRRSAKIKATLTPIALRKTALSASPAARRPFPAWIVADESGIAFPARVGVSPRVRDGLVLRTLSKRKKAGAKSPRPRASQHAHGAR